MARVHWSKWHCYVSSFWGRTTEDGHWSKVLEERPEHAEKYLEERTVLKGLVIQMGKSNCHFTLFR